MKKTELDKRYKFIDFTKSYIEVNGEFYQMKHPEDLFDFVKTEDYELLYGQVVDKLSRKRNFDFHVNDFFQELGYDFSKINIRELMNPFGKILFLKMLGDMEREVGNIILSEFSSYEEIQDFQDTFKAVSDRYFNKGMVDFTFQQHRVTQAYEKKFKEELSTFKKYIKLCAKGREKDAA